jgi:uncharacterized membrane protein YsdA (DUF1294 family)
MAATNTTGAAPQPRARWQSPFLASVVAAILIWGGVTLAIHYGLSWDLIWAWLIAGTVTALALYAYDKGTSKLGRWRVPEVILWLVSLAGGVAGAWVGILVLRHKTQHQSFWLVQGLATAVWAIVVGWWLLR